jgi:hypothetical protein
MCFMRRHVLGVRVRILVFPKGSKDLNACEVEFTTKKPDFIDGFFIDGFQNRL